jgi:transcriptional regulator with XRE-family HTH domain
MLKPASTISSYEQYSVHETANSLQDAAADAIIEREIQHIELSGATSSSSVRRLFMSGQTLGQRIRTLRKQLNMTQADLAGEHVSKGMLSLIENDLTNPSIRILQHIAERLGKPLSYFIDGQQGTATYAVQSAREELLERIAKFDLLVESRTWSAAGELMSEIESSGLAEDDRVLNADLQLKFGKFLYGASRFDEAEARLLRAEELYLTLGLYASAAEARLMTWVKYNHLLEFDKCQDAVNRAEHIYSQAINRDYLFEIRLLYIRSHLLVFMQASLREAQEDIDAAIKLSTQSNMYYYEELYRVKAMLAIETSNYSEFRENIEKSLRFCETTNSENLSLVLHSIAIGENRLGDSLRALEALRRAESVDVPYGIRRLPNYKIVHNLELGKAYYRLGQWEEARKAFESIDLSEFDKKAYYMPERIFLWKEIVHYGLLLNKLARFQEAVSIVEASISFLQDKKRDGALYFAYKCLSDIYAENGAYEQAYQYQTRALQYFRAPLEGSEPRTIEPKDKTLPA